VNRDGNSAGHEDADFIVAEKSVFQTRVPRPTNIGRHVVLVIMSIAISLVLVIIYAEIQAAKRTKVRASDSAEAEAKVST